MPKKPRIARARRGRKAFVPTPEQRHAIAFLAGARLTHAELCQVIVWPGTDKTISEETLRKAFAPELARGKAQLKKILLNAWLDTVRNGDDRSRWSAIEFGLRHINNWRDDAPGVHLDMGDGEGRKMSIRFVMPDRVLQMDNDDPPRQLDDKSKLLDLKANAPSSGVPLVRPRNGGKLDWMD